MNDKQKAEFDRIHSSNEFDGVRDIVRRLAGEFPEMMLGVFDFGSLVQVIPKPDHCLVTLSHIEGGFDGPFTVKAVSSFELAKHLVLTSLKQGRQDFGSTP